MDKKLYKVMNDQVTKELFSAYLYLSMAGYFESKGLPGMAHWMKLQANEEVSHGMKIFGYINDRGDTVMLGGFEKPESEFKSVRDVFEKALAHEKKVTASINNIYSVATGVEDYAAQVFLQWFLDEQVEEEKNAVDILSKLDYIKDNSMGLLMLDKELGSRAAES
ncbi:MAG TPA: ferritin [Candidatus Bathyarchaeia archaeon]|nr:ferritin [Candidatus Bathyarchaeia archaeon]